jgi:hypothetical protein
VSAGILPNNRIAVRLASVFVPNNCSFALVGNTESSNIFGVDIADFEGIFNHALGALPNFIGIVFHPSRLRIDLLVFLLVAANYLSPAIEYDKSGAACSLVDRCYVFFGQLSKIFLVMRSLTYIILDIEVKFISKTLVEGTPKVETGRFAQTRSHN